MINDSQELFSSLIREFAKLEAKEKNNEIIEREKIVLNNLVKYAEEKGIDIQLLQPNTLKDLSDESLNIMMTYLLNIENILNEIISYK